MSKVVKTGRHKQLENRLLFSFSQGFDIRVSDVKECVNLKLSIPIRCRFQVPCIMQKITQDQSRRCVEFIYFLTCLSPGWYCISSIKIILSFVVVCKCCSDSKNHGEKIVAV